MLTRILSLPIVVVTIIAASINLITFEPHYPFYPSPNFESRPHGVLVDTIVLHATQIETLRKTVKYFSMPESKLSAHFTIDRDGSIVQHVKIKDRAWHAGESAMKDGRSKVNDFSVGIELVNLNDGKDPYPQTQIAALNLLIRQIKFSLPIKFIVTHAEIAVPPGRKSDPAGLDLSRVEK